MSISVLLITRFRICEERIMSTNKISDLISSKLIKATDRLKEDYKSLIEFENTLKIPNLTTLQLNNIEESLINIETRIQGFSYKSISEVNKNLFLKDLKDIFYEYINERNIVQAKLLYLQNRVDTRLLIHKRREKEKNKVLSDQLIDIQDKLKSILNDIKSFKLNLPFSQLLEHYKLINRNLNKILTDLSQDSFSLFTEGEAYQQTTLALKVVKDEFLTLKTSLANLKIPISDMVRLLESLKLTYIDKIPLYEIYESFSPVKKEEIETRIIEVIKFPQYFPNLNITLDTKNKDDSYVIFSHKEVKKVETVEMDESIVPIEAISEESGMTSERRYEIFKRVLKKFESIKISMLANLLGMENETEVLEYILEIPDEFGFKIQNDTLIIEQRDEVLERIDMLVSMFDTDSSYGKESKI